MTRRATRGDAPPYRWHSAVLLLLVTAAASPAFAKPKECIEQHTRAQELRRSSKLLESKRLLSECTRDNSCPSEVARECASLLDQMVPDIPSIVFAAVDEQGRDTTAVKVFVDGQPVLEELDLDGVEFDPGRYQLRFESASGAVKEEHVILRVGERNRRILIDFRPAPVVVSAPDPLPTSETIPRRERAGVPAASYVLGAVGVVALGSFGYFAYSGKKQENELLDSCAPSAGFAGCSRSDVSEMRRNYLIADISLGVGVISLGSALITWLVSDGPSDSAPRRAGTPSATAFGAVPLRGGVGVGASGHF